MTLGGITFERPGARDPRWLIMLFLLSFDIFAVKWPSFNRAPTQWLAAVTACLCVELAGGAALDRPVRWLSAVVTSLGTFLLCDSPWVWTYAFVGGVSVLSKFLIRDESRHVFNPNNFGMTLALLWLPTQVLTDPSRWALPLSGSIVILLLGYMVARRAERMGVALAYQGTFALAALLRASVSGVSASVPLAPMTGAAFQLYSFYMVTDPSTTPRSLLGGVAFGVAVALADNLFRWYQFVNAPFYALVTVCAVVPLVRAGLIRARA